MLDLNWLSAQAHSIHDIFFTGFYALALLFILLGIISDYFKMPFGGVPTVPQLVGRAFVAALLLYSYPEITNTLSDVTDGIANQIGNFNQFHLVLSEMGDKLSTLSFSWTSVKDSLILLFSFLTFFLLYISVYIANAGIVYVWLILYVFSPVLIAFFILPATSFATQVLYRSLIEVCVWKIVWATLAALLWSSALGHMNDSPNGLNFLTVIAFNLILAVSLLLTPILVNALASKGLAQVTGSSLGLAAGAAALSPGVLAKSAIIKSGKTGASAGASTYGAIKSRFFETKEKPPKNTTQGKPPRVPAWHKKVPPPKEPPAFMKQDLENEKKENK